MGMRMTDFKKDKTGFSLIELVIVMMVIGMILSIGIANFRAMQVEGQYTKSENELGTLKTAVASYWRHNKVFPDITCIVLLSVPHPR